MAVKAIDTRYGGFRFRSRLEARWAVFLDDLGIAWEYEPEGYALKSGNYLPDFWLPGWQVWLEIKPEAPTVEELDKLQELAHGTGYAAIFGINLPQSEPVWLFCADRCDDGDDHCMCLCDFSVSKSDGKPSLCPIEAMGKFVAYQMNFSAVLEFFRGPSACSVFAPDGSMPITRAADAAKSARFEFGQTPRRGK